jgi:manganese/zinc/iron transport system substrate-binding protein
MIADLVRWIAHDLVELKQLIGAGVDPHLYKPIRDDVVDVLRADLVFFNGLLLEGRMSELLSEAASSTRNAVPLASAIPADRYLGEPGTDAKDPHVWMDVSMWSAASRSVEEELTKLLSDKNEIVRRRGKDLRSELEKLDQRGLQAIRSIPPRQRVLITSHDAFQYFGRRYGLEVQGIQGISTTSEAGLHRIPELIDLIQTRSVPAVFCESSVAGKLIDALIEGAQARGYPLRLGENLYSDALGPSGSGADSYIGMMESNFRAIAIALGGSWES